MPEQVQRRLDRDRVRSRAQQLDRRAQLGVERARPVHVPGAVPLDELGDLRPDDVRVHAHPADTAQLQERQDEVVVARVEIEPEVDDRPRLREVGVRLLHGGHGRDLGQLGHRLRLDVQHRTARDVVDDERPVGRVGDGREMGDDPARRRLVVVRRHDQERVGAEFVRALGQVDGVGGRVGARARDDGRAVADLVQRRRVEREPLVVRECRPLPRRTRDDEPVGAVVDEMSGKPAERVEVQASRRP